MQNLANYSGRPGHVRIGGNTDDYFLYDDGMNDFIVKDNPHSVGQGAVHSDVYLIGPRYFEAIERFPANTPVTFGLNLAYYRADYLDRIAAMAQAAVSKLTSVDLVSFEIGNEPDLYLGNAFRNGKSPLDETFTRADQDVDETDWFQGLGTDKSTRPSGSLVQRRFTHGSSSRQGCP